MALSVALIDKSQIVEKMLTHSLHYYAVDVLRFDSLEAYKSENFKKKPSAIFIDSSISIPDSLSQDFVVIMERGAKPSLQTPPFRINKPLDPVQVREVFQKSCPELKGSKFHEFLEHPESTFEGVSIAEPEKKKEEIEKLAPDFEEEEVKKQSLQNETEETSQDKTFNMDTKDMAPMAMSSKKSSISGEDLKSLVDEITSQLDFKELLEGAINSQARLQAQNLIRSATDKKGFSQSFLEEFEKSKEFKQMIQDQILIYLKKQLPLTLKEVVSKEIKKITEE